MRPIIRRRMAGISPSLPYDAEVEYLTSTGTQYAQLPNVNITYGMTAEIKYGITRKHGGTDIHLFGHYSGGVGVQCFITNANQVRVRWGSTNNCNLAVSVGDVCLLTVDGSGYLINRNLTKETQVTLNTGKNFFTGDDAWFNLFNLNEKGGNSIYSCHIGNACDVIAARVGEVGYFYNKATGQLFGNLGSDVFILGPDKAISGGY